MLSLAIWRRFGTAEFAEALGWVQRTDFAAILTLMPAAVEAAVQVWKSGSHAAGDPINQERKGHINLRKIPGTPAGCPWDTRRDKQGSTGRCPRHFLLFTIEKRTEKGSFAGTPAGCPGDTRPSRGFSEILCDLFLCAFSAP